MGSKAEETATFSLELEGLGDIEGLASGAADALDSLQDSIASDTKALGEMQKAMRLLKGGSTTNIAAFKELRDRIAAQKDKIAQSQAAYVNLGGAFKRTSTPADALGGKLGQLGDTAGKMSPQIGGLLSKFSALRGLLGGGVLIAGAAALAAGFIALGVAVIAATAALLRYGIAAADARRNEKLQLEGLTKVRNWYGLAAGSAADMQKAIDKVSDSSSLARGELVSMNEGLYRSGLRGAKLEQALEGVAMATDAAGAAQGEFYKSMFLGAGKYGGNTKKVLDDVRARFGQVAAMKALSLDSQSRKLRENFQRIFDGLKIEGLLKALKSITDLFSQSTASGRALKALAEIMLQPLINAVEFVGPLVKRFFQGMVIGALLVVIALQRVRNWLVDTFGGSEVLKGFDLQKAALWAGIFAFSVFAGAVLVTVAAFGLLAAGAALAIAPFVALVAFVQDARDKIAKKDWMGLGLLIARGVAAGITFGASEVVIAMGKMGADAFNALKKKLEIRSPSAKANRELGLPIPQGMARGVTRGAPEVQRAMVRMAELPAPPPANDSGERDGGGAGRGGRSLTSNGGLHVHTSSDKPRELVADVMRELERALEGAAIETGAPRAAVG
jgi:hypothetical protein